MFSLELQTSSQDMCLSLISEETRLIQAYDIRGPKTMDCCHDDRSEPFTLAVAIFYRGNESIAMPPIKSFLFWHGFERRLTVMKFNLHMLRAEVLWVIFQF